ncbi:hypothetical protein HY374_01620 [Candidatus Berkelbacteria bacterium]|nr:hypothetical protein [Candidatus Berkelbacteria bacterium]
MTEKPGFHISARGYLEGRAGRVPITPKPEIPETEKPLQPLTDIDEATQAPTLPSVDEPSQDLPNVHETRRHFLPPTEEEQQTDEYVLEELRMERRRDPEAIGQIANRIANDSAFADYVITRLKGEQSADRFHNYPALVEIFDNALKMSRIKLAEAISQRNKAQSDLGWEQDARYYERLADPDFHEMGQA